MSTINAEVLSGLLLAPRPDVELEAAWADIAIAIPELGALAMDQGGKRLHKDNVEHTIKVVAKTPPRLRVRLTALFHDVGKPPTRVISNALVTFYAHESVGGKITARVLARLGYDDTLCAEVARLVTLSGATKGSQQWTDSAVRRLIRESGDLLDDLLDFAIVDVTSRHERNHQAVRSEITTLRRRIEEVAELDSSRAWRPVVSGDAIMARYSLTPGRQIGVALGMVSTAQRDVETSGGVFSEDDAWALLDKHHSALSYQPLAPDDAR